MREINFLTYFLCVSVCIATGFSSFAQSTVNGTVTDTAGTRLPGVSVVVKGKSHIGTSTDLNGRYVIDVPIDATLVISIVGFGAQEIPVAGQSVIDVTLEMATSQLDDVVVVAFGSQKKREVVGAVTSINPQELKVPSSNLTTALAGKLAGVIAYQRSGEPGQDNAEFFIRGVTTFGYKKDPLILIDGIELSSQDLARLQIDDIATFSILKDAASTALYGARGANGVILVTTKQGVEGKAKLSVRLENSMSMPTRRIELADPVTYMRMNNEAVTTRNSLSRTPFPESKIDHTIAGTDPYVYPSVDWMELLFKDYTVNQRANMSVSGGGQIARYYVASTFNQDNGILKVDGQSNFNNNIKLQTFGLRSNVDISLTRTTNLGVKLYGSFDDYNGPIRGGGHYYALAVRSDPVSFAPYYPKEGAYSHLNHTLFGNTPDNLVNPYAKMVQGYMEYNRSLVLAQLDLKQDLSFITEGLKFDGLFNLTRYSYFDVTRQYSPYWYEVGFYDKLKKTYTLNLLNEATGREYLNYSEGAKETSATTFIQLITNYNRTFTDKHGISGSLIFFMQNRLKGNSGSLQTSLPYRNIGLSGRFTYSFNNKYFGEFNFGYTGSERFYQTNRFGFFPSGGLAWQVSNETFWEPLVDVVSSLKLRATYGIIGNDAIGSDSDRFFYLSEVNMDDAGKSATFGLDNSYYRPGVTVSRYSNALISWEKSYQRNLGVDIELFNNTNIIVDFWREHRRNILMTRASIPKTMGIPVSAITMANVGEAKGNGIDFSVDHSNFFPNGLWVQSRLNLTVAKSHFEVYEEPEYENEPWKSHVGYPITQRWGYIAERLFIDDEEVANSPVQNFGMLPRGGDIKYRDVNGDGRITTLDQVPIGFPTTPNIVYGFGFSVGYKTMDFSCFFQGLSEESFWIDLSATTPFAASSVDGLMLKNQVLQAYADDYWSENGNRDPYALWPRLSPSIHPNNNQTSTWFMRDGAFLRLKQAEIGYSLPEQAAKKIYLEKARLYINGTNLLTWSRFKLWDVEMAGNGLRYPIQKVFNVGIQVSL